MTQKHLFQLLLLAAGIQLAVLHGALFRSHPAFQCPLTVGSLSALAITATSAPARRAPAALRHVDGFPVLGLLRPLRRPGPRGPKAIPCPCESNVIARLRPPVRPLERPRWPSLGGGRFAGGAPRGGRG